MKSQVTLSFALLLALGCGGTPTQEATFANVQKVMDRACLFGTSCHGTQGKRGDLVLASSAAYCQLVGQSGGATFREMARAAFPRRVQPGNKDASYLYKKLVLTDAEHGRDKPLGERMPQGSALDTTEIDLFGRWIDGGAPKGEGDGQGADGCM